MTEVGSQERRFRGRPRHRDDVIKLKLWDKPRNFEMLFKHLGLLTKKLEVKVQEDLVARLNEGRKR